MEALIPADLALVVEMAPVVVAVQVVAAVLVVAASMAAVPVVEVKVVPVGAVKVEKVVKEAQAVVVPKMGQLAKKQKFALTKSTTKMSHTITLLKLSVASKISSIATSTDMGQTRIGCDLMEAL